MDAPKVVKAAEASTSKILRKDPCRVVLLGCGAVGTCFIRLLKPRLGIKFDKVTVIDAQEIARASLPHDFFDEGGTFIHRTLTPENIVDVLSDLVPTSSLVVDLAFPVNTIAVLDFCRRRGAIYVNSAVDKGDCGCCPVQGEPLPDELVVGKGNREKGESASSSSSSSTVDPSNRHSPLPTSTTPHANTREILPPDATTPTTPPHVASDPLTTLGATPFTSRPRCVPALCTKPGGADVDPPDPDKQPDSGTTMPPIQRNEQEPNHSNPDGLEGPKKQHDRPRIPLAGDPGADPHPGGEGEGDEKSSKPKAFPTKPPGAGQPPKHDPKPEDEAKEDTLCGVFKQLKSQVSEWPHDATTAVLDHGANPGLVSAFVKKALTDIATSVLQREKDPALEAALSRESWAEVSHLLGVHTVLVSETDTQVSAVPVEPGCLLNTWSPRNFVDEATSFPEVSFGTHEKSLPPGAMILDAADASVAFPGARGLDVRAWAWTPPDEEDDDDSAGHFCGYLIPHDETNTISACLTSREQDGTVTYRPTLGFVYSPCPHACESLAQVAAGKSPSGWRVLAGDELERGKDSIGTLLLGQHGAWWTGSVLDVSEAKKLVPSQNATVVQVAIAVAAACAWSLANPCRGVCFPEDLPHREILEFCQPFLGKLVSKPVQWAPPISAPATGSWQFADLIDESSKPVLGL